MYGARSCEPRRSRAPARRKSRPVSRVLSRAIIPLGSPSPWTSSGLPRSARGSALHPPCGRCGFPIWPCSRWGLPCRRVLPPTRCALTAPFHPCRSRQGLGRSALCCTFRGLAPPRCYLAPDPPEPGLSSTEAKLQQRLPGRLSSPTIRRQPWKSNVSRAASAARGTARRECIGRRARRTRQLRRDGGCTRRG